MPKPIFVLLVWLVILGIIFGIPFGLTRRKARRDRRRIMADGLSATGLVTKISSSNPNEPTVCFSFQPNGATQAVEGQQLTTSAAISRLGLMVGSTVQVHYLPKWSRWGFIPQLTYAERHPADGDPRTNEPPLFFVTFGNRTANPFRWVGSGEVQAVGQNVRITANRQRTLWFSQIETREFALSGIVDVEHHDAALRLTVLDAKGKPRALQLQMVNAAQAEVLARLLPETKTAKFAPVLAEHSEFDATLRKLTPKPYVTPALIAVNTMMFLVAVALGGGVLVANPEIMIGLGTDYTPLTLGGQWWRLLTSVFLHFGLLHLAFNMWALYVNGRLAERIFGSVRFLVIYLVAGLAGSLASLLWHPVVNGAGASGAIFGVLGALLAFFVKKEGGVPASVTKAQLRIAVIFVAYSLLNGARYRGIDNAAHMGGLVGGFLLGYVLSRPLATNRNERPWTKQWATALVLCTGMGTMVAYLLSTGALGPGYAHLPMHQTAATDHPAPVLTAPRKAQAALPSSVADPALAAMVAQEISNLNVKPKTVIVPSDQSYEALIAIRHGDYVTANRIATEVLSRSRLQRWRFYPFNEFMNSMTRGGNDPVLLDNLRSWIRHDPKSAIAYLIRAKYYKDAAWNARGGDTADKVPGRLMDVFTEDLELAAADVRMSISLNPKIPWSYYLMMDVVSGNGNSRGLEAAFQYGIKAYPGYYELYRLRLFYLTPKWGGSVKAMYAFIDQYAGGAPENSSLKLLYLHLYAYLLDAADFDCSSLKGDSWQQCVDGEISGTATPELMDGMVKALNLYKVSDPIEFSMALWPPLGMIAAGGRSYSGVGTVLQKAASTMGSDNRLMDEPGHNSFVLDDITARVWAQIGNGANAEKKYLEALTDVEHTSFPDEAQKDAALAWIYDDLTTFAHDNGQFINIIVYQDAANLVGGHNHANAPWEKCHAYYKLKHYAEAVTECTAQMEGNGNSLESQYTRARAYEGLHQWDAAMADFTPVADSADNWLRDGAAIEMSVILGNKNDVAGELALLNRYPYLFDPNLQPPDDLAVAFNNRCYAYMKLGLLKQALDDCNTSLRYGRIPDAIQKQQELIKQLGVKAAT